MAEDGFTYERAAIERWLSQVLIVIVAHRRVAV